MILSRWPFLKAPEKLSSKQQAQLDSLLQRFLAISEHHWLKERLRTLYRCTTRIAGETLFASMLLAMEESEDVPVLLWARTLPSWH